jgi:hypothetical protein
MIQCPHCRGTTTEVVTNYAVAGMLANEVVDPTSTHKCTIHPTELVSVFCETCSVFICNKCYDTRDQPHAGHSRVSYEEAVSLVTNDIKEVLKTVETELSHLNDLKMATDMRRGKVKELKQTAQQYVSNVVGMINSALQTTINQLDSYESSFVDSIDNRAELENMRADLRSLNTSCEPGPSSRILEQYVAHRDFIRQRIRGVVRTDSLNESLDRISLDAAVVDEYPIPELQLHIPETVSLVTLRFPRRSSTPGTSMAAVSQSGRTSSDLPTRYPIPRTTSNDTLSI